MKILLATTLDLKREGRWDIDYHLPPVGIKQFPEKLLVPVSYCADIIRWTKNPTKDADVLFQYIDIASIDVDSGTISQAQELLGEEAPSRARKLVQAYDIIISTCRPTRGAIAVIPEELHGQICSTGFSVIRAKENVNPFYLHFALRMPSTLEQFRKWSTGSSYPAILDSDVAKTRIPLPSPDVQNQIAKIIREAALEREYAIKQANSVWHETVDSVIYDLALQTSTTASSKTHTEIIYSIEQIQERIESLSPLIDKDEDSPSSDTNDIHQNTLFPTDPAKEDHSQKSNGKLLQKRKKRTDQNNITIVPNLLRISE